MKKTLFAFGLVVIAAAAMAMAPPVDKLVLGQQRCGNNLCVGSPATQVNMKGNVLVDLPILPTATNVIIDGGLIVTGNVQINGTTTSSGLYPTAAITTLDAGQVLVQNTLQTLGAIRADPSTLSVATVDAGQMFIQNTLQLNGSLNVTATTIAGTCTLGGQSPSTCTATVRSGCRPICTLQGGSAAIAAAGVACAVSSTTLTATSANAGNQVVSYFCP